MPLTAQRFRDNDTLTRCVDEGYRMHRGEQDREAVKRLQLALYDLCYPQITTIDGVWGERTDEAVVQFKTEEALTPSDPVASVGTIGQLDAYFAWESAYPDHPDPGTAGLVELGYETATEAASILGSARKVLEDLPWGTTPGTPHEAETHAAILAFTGTDAGSPGYQAQEHRARLLTLLGACQLFLAPDSGDLTVEAVDRPGWHASTGHSFYWAYRYRVGSRTLTVTPPFRNALGAVDRLATLLRLAAATADPDLAAHGYPGTRRHGHLTPAERRTNTVGLACLVLFAGAGTSDLVHLPPTWGDLSSL